MMNTSKKRLLIAAGLSVAAVALAPAGAGASPYDYNDVSDHTVQSVADYDDHTTGAHQGTIVDELANDGRFTTLLAAVKAAGLVDALNSADQKTVFAPTDEAFAALPAGTLDSLLADPSALSAILTYHVVAGNVDSDAALDAGEATTLNGQMLNIGEGDDGYAYINDSRLVQTDIMATNGVVHVIDAVLLPSM